MKRNQRNLNFDHLPLSLNFRIVLRFSRLCVQSWSFL